MYDLHQHHGYSGRRVFDWIRRVAEAREERDRLSGDQQLMRDKLRLMSKQHRAAVTVQKAWRRNLARRKTLAKEKEWRQSEHGRMLLEVNKRTMDHEDLKSYYRQLDPVELHAQHAVAQTHAGQDMVPIEQKMEEIKQRTEYAERLQYIEAQYNAAADDTRRRKQFENMKKDFDKTVRKEAMIELAADSTQKKKHKSWNQEPAAKAFDKLVRTSHSCSRKASVNAVEALGLG